MLFFKRYKIRSFEMGLYFRDGEFRGLLGAGTHWFFDLLGKVAVEIVSRRAPFLAHEKLDLIVKSGELKGHAEVLDLKDDERALVWVDRRFAWIVGPGQCAYWTQPRDVRVEHGRRAPGAVRTSRDERHLPPSVRPRAPRDGHGRARLRGGAVPRRPLHRHA